MHFHVVWSCLIIGWLQFSALAATPELVTNAPPSLHNVFRLSPRVISGSQPEGDVDFAWLRDQGVKTILSVDGAQPDLEQAHRYGLRYVHLPIGYGGIASNRLVELAKVAEAIPGRFYIHCHHGKHRGPAAAAIVCEATENWSEFEATAFLREAGTASEYKGLYRSVSDFRKINPQVLVGFTNAFPETSPQPGIVQTMLSLDSMMENMKACQKAGWRSPSEHPDVTPAHEAVLLWEQLREFGRSAATQAKPKAYQDLLAEAEKAADGLRTQLKMTLPEQTASLAPEDAALRQVAESCTACHQRYRN